MNTFVPKQIDGWEKSPHSKMWLLFQIWQAWNSVVVIIIIPFHLLFTKAWNWVFWPITECTSKVISLQGGQASFRVSLKIPRFLTTVHPKNFFFVGYGPQKSAKVDYSHGQFFNSGELLAKNCKYLPCLLDSVLRRRMNSNVVNRIIFSSRCHHHWNSNFLFECQHLPENIKQNIKIKFKTFSILFWF